MNILIVDDEELARKLIIEFLFQSKETFQIFEASNTSVAREIIEKNQKIDIIFLDVEMPGESGLDFINSLSYEGKIIFTTAYSEHAVKAFELNAVDYLLKPFSLQRFTEAFTKVLRKDQTAQLSLIKSYLEKEKLDERLLIKDGNRSCFVKYKEIIAIEALGDYVKVISVNETLIEHNKISYYESLLPEKYFKRVHRSTIINLECIVEMNSKNGKNSVLMINQIQYDLSKTGHEKLKKT
jgi:two-component system, LytTR family, response regulator